MMKRPLLLLAALLLTTQSGSAETIDVFDNHGGLQKDFVWMGAPDVFRYFKKCTA
jgi:hypothetical protein